MKSSTKPMHACSLGAPSLRLFLAPTLLALLLADFSFCASAASSSQGKRGSLQPSVRRRRRSSNLVESSQKPAVPAAIRRRRRGRKRGQGSSMEPGLDPDEATQSHEQEQTAHTLLEEQPAHTSGKIVEANDESAIGNSFISLASPVHRIMVPSPAIEDLENTSEEPPKGLEVGAHNSSTGSSAAMPNASLQPHSGVWDSAGMRVVHAWNRTIGNVTAVPPQEISTKQRFLDTILHHTVGCLVAFVASIVLIYAAAMVIKSWARQVTLRRVRVKIRRANEFFLGLHGDRQICLRCVEFIQSSSPSTVTFLCGHSFHVRCSNDCYKRRTQEYGDSSSPGSCPICTGTPMSAPSQSTEQAIEATHELPDVSDGQGGSSQDVARLFTLHSIREQYPGILSGEEFQRLATEPTAVLQSEMQFANQLQRDAKAPFLRQFVKSKMTSIFV